MDLSGETALIMNHAAVTLAETASPYNIFSHKSIQRLLEVICEFSARTSPEAWDTNH